MTYMPQDFRGTLIRQQRERSERNRQAVVDALVNSGGSIHDRYALLWNQQMERLNCFLHLRTKSFSLRNFMYLHAVNYINYIDGDN